MSKSEIDQFLGEHRYLRLATVSENGWPHVAPVGYTRLERSEELYVLSHPDQRKCQNMFYNNRVGAVVDDGHAYTTLRGVFVHGYATVVTDGDLIQSIEQSWIEDVYDGRLPDVVKAVYSMRDAWIWFEIDPANIVSWDNTKVEEAQLQEQGKEIDNPFTYNIPDDIGAATPER